MSYYYEKRSDCKNYHFVNHKTKPYAASHFHSAQEILLVKRGRMLARINEREYHINGGEGCFVDKFCIHGFYDLEDNTEIYVFVGNSDFFEVLQSDMCGMPPVKFNFCDFDLLNKMMECYKGTDNEGIRIILFKSMLSFLMARIAQKNTLTKYREVKSTKDICEILSYICDHFREDISLQSLAEHFGYSPQYFSSMFHKHMNINLTEYINIARVNYARKLLKGDKSIAEIAYESGFNSLNSFYRAYKKVFGCAPRA